MQTCIHTLYINIYIYVVLAALEHVSSHSLHCSDPVMRASSVVCECSCWFGGARVAPSCPVQADLSTKSLAPSLTRSIARAQGWYGARDRGFDLGYRLFASLGIGTSVEQSILGVNDKVFLSLSLSVLYMPVHDLRKF